MEQKVIKIGSSAGLTLSKEALRKLGVKIGDVVETNTAEEVFTAKAKKKGLDAIDPEVLKWGDEFIVKNRQLLERLKDK
jgi:antitoxin component of MazEF toxin-antitoxin module